jgi:hypothetical protein
MSNVIPETMNVVLEKKAASRTISYHRNTPGTQPVAGQDSGPPVRTLTRRRITPIAMSPNPRV